MAQRYEILIESIHIKYPKLVNIVISGTICNCADDIII